MMKHRVDVLQNPPVVRFRDAIVLRGVMCRKALLGSLVLQELSELVTHIFASTIGVKMFDVGPMLCLGPVCKHFVSLQSLILCAQKASGCVLCMVVCKSDIVFATTDGRYRRRSP